MVNREYVVRLKDGLWEVWLDDQLLSFAGTQVAALRTAEALADTAAWRGETPTIVVYALDGRPIESGDRASGPAAEPAKKKPRARRG